MSLTVLSVGYPFARVGPDRAGGAEQVLTMVEEAIVAVGDRSVVLAPIGSSCRGKLVSFTAVDSLVDAGARDAVYQEVRCVLADAIDRFGVDVIHMHGLDFLA